MGESLTTGTSITTSQAVDSTCSAQLTHVQWLIVTSCTAVGSEQKSVTGYSVTPKQISSHARPELDSLHDVSRGKGTNCIFKLQKTPYRLDKQ